MTHILIDTANTFFRARHVIRGDTSEKIGMAIHIMMNSIKKAWQDFDGTHLVFCLEGRSWRKDHYAPYKRNRKDAVDAMTQQEKEELTPYSFRHRFAYYGHNWQQEDGTYRLPKQVADALGHSLDIHLLSYTSFNTRELAKSFDQQPVLR